MRNYEISFIVDPVLSGEEIKATAQTYIDHLKNQGCTIVYVDEMGLRTLAYPINKRNSGVYYSIEIQSEDGQFLDEFELALRRDERIMRFLTVKLDKYGIKYNEDKRNGLIGKARKHKQEKAAKQDRKAHEVSRPKKAPAPEVKAPQAEAEAAKGTKGTAAVAEEEE